MSMTCKERIESVINGKQPDYTPVMGGWIACPEHICALSGASMEEYWRDPKAVSITAYKNLGTDGLVDLYVPANKNDFRFIDEHTYSNATQNLSIEEVLEQIDAMPEPEQIEADFDFDIKYREFRSDLLKYKNLCDPMVWMPAQWFAGARLAWYQEFGYENFFMLFGLYEKHIRKLMEIGCVRGRNNGRLVARAIEEGLHPKAMFFGEDICNQRGPMVNPAFLEKYWAPLLRRSLEPLNQVGCRTIWHCDGDVRPILDMLLDCGIGGLQGFQPECGMTIDYVTKKRTSNGNRLLILGPLSVTGELPVLTSGEVRQKVEYAIQCCRGNADLILFTANTINPDVPLENIRAMYDARLQF